MIRRSDNSRGNRPVEETGSRPMQISNKKMHAFVITFVIISSCVSLLGSSYILCQLRQGEALLELKEKKSRPRLFLHVGPGKMGTTTIQVAIDKDRKTAEYMQDNFCPFVDTDSFLKLSVELNRAGFMPTPAMTKKLNVVGAHLQDCFGQGYDVFLSSEFLGLVSKEQYESVFWPSFKDFDLKIVVGYRRFFDWVPSVFFQKSKVKSGKFAKWPKQGDFELADFNTDFLKRPSTSKLYTDAYIDNWLNIVKIEDIFIYNFHEDRNLLKTLYCKILGARTLCMRVSVLDPPRSLNVGYANDYDSIALAAFHQGLIEPNGVSRKQAAKRIESYFKKINMTASDFPRICFPKSRLEEVLNKTKRVESNLFPEFYSGEKGEIVMEKEFQNIKETKYCSVATDKIIKEHDFTKIF